MKVLLWMPFFLLVTITANAQVANLTIDASVNKGAMHRYEQYNSAEPLCDTCLGDRQLLDSLHTKYLRTFFFFNGGISPSLGTYNIDDKIAQFKKMLSWNDYRLILTISHSSPYNRDTSYGNVTAAPPVNVAMYKTMITDVITRLKDSFPRLEYIQAWNEPNLLRDGMKKTMEYDLYKQIYTAFAEVVQSINSTLPINAIKLKVGGPNITHYSPDSAYIYKLIRFCDSSNLPLDFLDYHEYSLRATPARIKQRLDAMRDSLNVHGFTQTEVWMSEYGTVGGGDNTAPTTSELLQTSAFIAAADQYLADGNADKPIHWTGRHETNYIKSEFVENRVGKVYPFYNVLRAEALMKDTRIGVQSDQLNANGIGVGAIASMDSTAVTALIRNYQNTGSGAYTAKATLKNLPAGMSGKQVKVQVYLVDDTHSNYRYDSTKDKLEKIQEYILPASAAYTATIKMLRNSVALVVFTPVNTTSFSSGNLAVLRYGDGFADTTKSLPLFIDEYSTAGALLQSFALPTAQDSINMAVTGASFSASLGKGMLTLGSDKNRLILVGFNAGVGTSTVTTYDSILNNRRVLALVDNNGQLNTTVSTSQLGIEGGINNGKDVWLYGTSIASTGVYVQHASLDTPNVLTAITTTPTSSRSINISNGQLYLCSYNLGSYRLGTVGSGLPVSGTATMAAVSGIGSPSGSSFRQFVLLDMDTAIAGPDVLYIADDGGTGAAGGLIRKYSFDGTTWTTRSTYSIAGLTNNKLYSMTGKLASGKPVLYFVTPTNLATVTDNASRTANISAAQSSLAVSPDAAREFRGIAFTPEALPPSGLLSEEQLKLFVNKKNEKIVLNWVATAAGANTYYNILRSADGKDFSSIGRVFFNNEIDESYTDYMPLTGKCYYRVIQVNADGRNIVSAIKAVGNVYGAGNVLKVYSITSNMLHASFSAGKDGNAIVQLNDFSGKSLLRKGEQIRKGANTILLPITNFSNGAYILTAAMDGKLYSVKFIKP